MRIVIDTNVIISALFFGGLPAKFLGLAHNGKYKPIASAEIMAEYETIVESMKLKKTKYRHVVDDAVFLELIEPFEIIPAKTKIEICRDPDDDKFIACAIDGKCKYVVSGDSDLLDIKQFGGVEIVTVREVMDDLYNDTADD